MELEMRQNADNFEEERSFEKKNMKRDFEKSQLQEKKASEELVWLKSQLANQKEKLKASNEENDVM